MKSLWVRVKINFLLGYDVNDDLRKIYDCIMYEYNPMIKLPFRPSSLYKPLITSTLLVIF